MISQSQKKSHQTLKWIINQRKHGSKIKRIQKVHGVFAVLGLKADSMMPSIPHERPRYFLT